MSVSMAAGIIEPSSQARSWTTRLCWALRPALLCDLLVVVLLASWAGSKLDLVVNHGLVGGNGDESHRLVISHRLCHNFSANIYSYFFHQPWPPLPYILQGTTFRLQQGLGLSIDFGTAAVCSSTCAYVLAIALAYAALAIRFQRVAGLIALVLALSLRVLTGLAITPMAESYCTCFLAWAFLLAAVPGAFRGRAILIGLAVMLATQCRSEVVVLSVVFAVYCLREHGRLASVACFSIAVFPFLLKAIVNLATGFTGMTYLNQQDFYNLKDNWHANALKAWDALQRHVHEEHAFVTLATLLFLAAVCGALGRRALGSRTGGESGFRSRYFWLLVGAAGTLTAFILMAMASGRIIPNPRFLVISHFLWTLPASVAASLPLARLGKLYQEREALGRALRKSPWRGLGSAVSVVCLVVLAGSLFQAVASFYASAVSFHKEDAARVPKPILAAKEWLHENYRHGHVCFDSLIWWETFLFYHSLRNDAESTQFMVYDRPPGDWLEGAPTERGECYVAAMHRYVEAFRPELIVLAGPGYRRFLEDVGKFVDWNEKASYLRPFLNEREDGTLQMMDSPYWKKSESLAVTLWPAFQNDAVAIYRAHYRVLH